MTRGRLLRDSKEAEALVIMEALRIFSFISRKIDCGERFLQRYFLGKPRCKKAVEAPICLKRDQVFGLLIYVTFRDVVRSGTGFVDALAKQGVTKVISREVVL